MWDQTSAVVSMDGLAQHVMSPTVTHHVNMGAIVWRQTLALVLVVILVYIVKSGSALLIAPMEATALHQTLATALM